MIDPFRPDYENPPASPERPCYRYQRDHDGLCLLSIITPFYNPGEVFLATADSVFGQSFQNWEWVITDDGSTDPRSLEVLRSVAHRDKRITVLHQANRGPSAARNAAFGASRGQYVFLLDSDDLIEPTYLEKALWRLATQPQYAFCNTWCVQFGDEVALLRAGFEFGRSYVQDNFTPIFAVIRREVYASVGGFDETIESGHEDWDFWLALANAGHWGCTIHEYLAWYRRTSRGRFARVMSEIGSHAPFRRFLKEKYPDLKRRFPSPAASEHGPYHDVKAVPPFENDLAKPSTTPRVLFVLPWLVTGGADQVNVDWARGLAGRGYEVTVCTTLPSANEWLPRMAAVTPDVFVLPRFLALPDYPRFISYLIASRKVDVVLINASTLGYHLLPFLRSMHPHVTFVDLCHVQEPHWLNGGHPRFAAGYQDALDLNLTTTADLRDWMVRRGADPDRIKVCYTGVDTTMLEPLVAGRAALRAALDLDEDTPTLIFGGRICAQKRPQTLAAILAELARREFAYRCLIVGDGDLQPTLEKSIRKHGLKDQVRFLGTVPHRRWLELLCASDALLLPSEYEGISVALFEAMALGVVPVAARVGGQPEVVGDDCGVLVPSGADEVSRYADEIVRLFANRPRRDAMARACRARVAARFDLPRSVAAFEAALARARELSRRRPRSAVPPGLGRELAVLAVEYARITVRYSDDRRINALLTRLRQSPAGRRLLAQAWVQRLGRAVRGALARRR